jgi:hypothetical protein
VVNIETKRILYSLTEDRLYGLIKEHMIPDLQKTDQFNPCDCFSVEYDLICELKCRRTHYSDLLIEKIKWDKLILSEKVRYINSTPDGVFSFDLRKIQEPEWFEGTMPKTTEFERNDYITKVVGYIPLKCGKNITKRVIWGAR